MMTSYGAEELASKDELFEGPEYSQAFKNPKDHPTRPNVLLIGDSISNAYTVDVRKLLHGKADVFRIPGNGKNSAYGLKNLDKWLGSRQWDVIHFNWGLWDLCYRNPKSKTQGYRDKVNGTITATPEQYRANMEKIVARLKQTDATLIWCTTTPVPEHEAGRKLGDDLVYNQIAAEIMKANGVGINDLHAHALLKYSEIQRQKGDVHFTPQGSAYLAEKVAQEISDVLVETLHSPNGKIEVTLDAGKLNYSVKLNGETIISKSALGLKPDAAAVLEVVEVSRSTGDETWKPVWGNQGQVRDHYNEIQLKVGTPSAQTVVLRVYDDGIAIRYQLPKAGTFSDKAYAFEATEVSFASETPKAWFPLTQVIVSDETDLNSWKPAKKGQKINKNARFDFKPDVIRTPFTVKLSGQAYISVHEAEVVQSDVADVRLAGNTLTYNSKINASGGQVTPWRTVTIAKRPAELIESSMILNLNEPSRLDNTSWIKPGVTMWDWRAHGAHADDGFEYGITTESYIRFIDFAADAGVEYLLIDAEWYGPERDVKSDPKTPIPEVDIEKVCAHANEKGVGIWLYVNDKGLTKWDLDETLSVYQKWGVVGIKHGFGSSSNRKSIEKDLNVVKKCAEYGIMLVRHESAKPTGVNRTYPNIMSYEYVNSMLDSAQRPAATPSRVINNLFVFGLAGPVDRSCGLYDLDTYIARDKCHRQIPSTVVSQTAQCFLFPSGLVTLPDIPDAYRRKADLFEFVGQLPMNWDETKVLEAEIGKHITLARKAGDAWFVGALADEQGRQTSIVLDFLEKGITYDVTLYEDAPDAHYEYIGPMNKIEARKLKQKLEPQKTRRELYQVKKMTAKKGDAIPVTIAPGGGHCMWIRPVK
ncbi:glycoside hydrolase family 97 catalytic domain-containing protein [Pontiellaceae bacterium B12227]|nr:glycoside hydrolase family 97 catalytic domain-containing protein [Pontiellaceae bacterium B12227]